MCALVLVCCEHACACACVCVCVVHGVCVWFTFVCGRVCVAHVFVCGARLCVCRCMRVFVWHGPHMCVCAYVPTHTHAHIPVDGRLSCGWCEIGFL